MTREEKRIAIAKACGFLFDENGTRSIRCDRWGWPIPDYFGSLDAMHEAEKIIEPHQEKLWVENLRKVVHGKKRRSTSNRMVRATAAERAEALGLTCFLWKEGE